ncbi:MAG: cupin domain-containing protein [Candidatus Eremiobacteraeota bacterium]|nr:cupin domain-containing protein [Candidatus Eremiobacteraeota bacterium]
MKKYEGSTFEESRAWHGPDIAHINNAAVKLRWTDQPYIWHKNTGEEIFAVLSGIVDMHVRAQGREEVITLHAGELLHVENGDEHVAHPRGPARILVVEDSNSD